MKTVCLIIMAAFCVYLGMKKARSYSKRRITLENIGDDLSGILRSMEYSRLPIKRLVETLSPCKSTDFWDGLLKNMDGCECLHEAYLKTVNSTGEGEGVFDCLSQEDKAVLNDCFFSLGKCGIDSEKKKLEFTVEKLRLLSDEARACEKKNVKLYSYLGLLLGLSFVLVFL